MKIALQLILDFCGSSDYLKYIACSEMLVDLQLCRNWR